MSKTIHTDRGDMHLKTNGHRRPLVSLLDVPEPDRNDFNYILSTDPDCILDDAANDLRFFYYRGAWYDYLEFTVASDQIKALGFDGMQAQSMFDAVIVRWFDADGNTLDDEIVVGYLHW